jgi:hypothetical protein
MTTAVLCATAADTAYLQGNTVLRGGTSGVWITITAAAGFGVGCAIHAIY